jgi:surface protein
MEHEPSNHYGEHVLEGHTFQPADRGWNVSRVTNMAGMFSKATRFNQPIGSWEVSNVTDMSYMFSEATVFDQSIGGWNVSRVTNMAFMFFQASRFNQPIGDWDVGRVTDMTCVFAGAIEFNQPKSAPVLVESASVNQPVGQVTDMSSTGDGWVDRWWSLMKMVMWSIVTGICVAYMARAWLPAMTRWKGE